MELAPSEQAVIDRFEGDLAVLLVGDTRRVVDVPRAQLPPGSREGLWLRVTIVNGALLSAAIDADATTAARARIAAKLARLRRGDHLAGEAEPDG